MAVEQSREDLVNHLSDSLKFLKQSCGTFDAGHEEESKRIATEIRKLCHDTKNSKSLLGLLGMKEGSFHDSALPFHENNPIPYSGLIATHSGGGGCYLPLLDRFGSNILNKVPFNEWWNQMIFTDIEGNRFSRKEVVLAVANTDGGDHVDPTLDPIYANLSRMNSLGRWVGSGNNWRRMGTPVLATIRQIAHELLKTLNPSYQIPPQPIMKPGLTFLEIGVKTIPLPKQKVGRNDPCPCNSGIKFKKCHGKND